MTTIYADYKFVRTLKDAFSITVALIDKVDPFVVLRKDGDKNRIVTTCNDVIGAFDFDNKVDGELTEEVFSKRLCDFLCSYLPDFPDDVKIEIGNKIDVRVDGKKVLSLNKLDVSTALYQIPDDMDPICEIEFDLKSKLSDFSGYTDDGSSRFTALTGVFFKTTRDQLELIATDGRRLIDYKDDSPCSKEFEATVASSTIRKIVRFLGSGTSLLSNGDRVGFKKDNVSLMCSRINAAFPQKSIDGILNRVGERKAKLNVRETYDATYKTTFTSDNFRVLMKLDNDEMTLSSENSQFGVTEVSVPCKYNRPSIEMRFNYQYLLECLNSCESEYVTARFNENTPVLFEDGKTKIFIMPLT